MEAVYHEQVLERALGGAAPVRRVSPRALDAILKANLGQDSLQGLLHPTYHFDNSLVAESLAYIETCRSQAASAPHARAAWAAFGRLTHAAQDFYSHSNYVTLWAERHAKSSLPPLTAM